MISPISNATWSISIKLYRCTMFHFGLSSEDGITVLTVGPFITEIIH